MGLLEEIDKLELSDEQKDALKREYGLEVGTRDDELSRLRRSNRRAEVEREVSALSDLGFSDAPGLLKFVRRVFLSDDEQPGGVLLSDADLELSGDESTGARSEEEISVAGALREFIKLMPRNQEGNLKLSDQALAGDDHGKPADEQQEDQEQKDERRQRVESTLGRPVERKRTRYGGMVS